MKIKASPMPALIAAAEFRVNMQMATRGINALAHEAKRLAARAVLDGAEPSPEFSEAAHIEGITVDELAAHILAKPHELLARDNQRRAVIVRLRSARNEADIAAVLDAAGIVPLPPTSRVTP